MQVLAKLGGRGFTQVANSYLKDGNLDGKFSALKQSLKRPDEETFRLLRAISENQGYQKDAVLLPRSALEALAYHNRWPDVVHGMMLWRSSSPREVVDALLSHPPLDEVNLAPAIADVTDEDSPSPGSVRVLGFARYSPLNARVRSLLASTPPESELALACAVNLGFCEDDATEAVSLIAGQLGVEDHRYQARLALLRIGSSTSIDALFADLRLRFDLSLAIQLAHRADSEQRAIELIKTYMAELSTPRLEDALDELLIWDQELIVPLLGDVRIRDRLLESSFSDEGNSRVVGSKARAIRALGRFDREAANHAALRAFKNTEGHDRQLYPNLIVEFSGREAVDILVAQAAIEASTLVIWSIASALEALDYVDALSALFTSPELSRRLTGCKLAERIRLSDSMATMLRSLTEDLDNSVVAAACCALRFQRDARSAEMLKEAVQSERDLSRRWILIDALLSVSLVGEKDQPFPTWVNEVFGGSGQLERHYVEEGLKLRRDELNKEAAERDKG
jgi:hypothetical protein